MLEESCKSNLRIPLSFSEVSVSSLASSSAVSSIDLAFSFRSVSTVSVRFWLASSTCAASSFLPRLTKPVEGGLALQVPSLNY